jgi:hypothetical protein
MRELAGIAGAALAGAAAALAGAWAGSPDALGGSPAEPRAAAFGGLLVLAALTGPLGAVPAVFRRRGASPAQRRRVLTAVIAAPLSGAAVLWALGGAGAAETLQAFVYLVALAWLSAGVARTLWSAGAGPGSAAALGALTPAVLMVALPAVGAALPETSGGAQALRALLHASPAAVLGGSILGVDVLRSPALYGLVHVAQAAPFAYARAWPAVLGAGAVAAALQPVAAVLRTSLRDGILRRRFTLTPPDEAS